MDIYKDFDTNMIIGQGKEFAEELVGIFKEFPVQWVYFSWLIFAKLGLYLSK